MTDFWTDIDGEILHCLSVTPLTVPTEIAQKLAPTETAAQFVLAMLAMAGKVRIRLVERASVPSERAAV